MKHITIWKGVFSILMMIVGLQAMSQTDITKYYLINYGFDADFDYTAESTAEVKEEIKEINGWTPELSADYTITGVYEFGFGGTFNGAKVPATGYTEGEGGGLALSTGWGQTFCYYQTMTLPAGTYTVNVPTYNGKSVTAGMSRLSWIPDGGTAVTSTCSKYPAKKWTLDQITFTLTEETSGRLQIGYKATSGSSANSANIVIDYVQILGENMVVDKTSLSTNIRVANRLYGTGTGKGADVLKAAIDLAQGVYDNADSSMPDILNANSTLERAIEEYEFLNASPDDPLNITDRIKNPSFETDGTSGWTVKNMVAQSNTVFSRKVGTYYMEAYADMGSKIAEASVTQTIKRLAKGKYKLNANALHIQQTGANSTTNKGAAQTGAYLFAGVAKVAVTSMKGYSLIFTVVEDLSDVEIGLKTEDATGNYLCVDNFRLQYIGAMDLADYAQEVQTLMDEGQKFLDAGIQNSVAATLSEAMELGRKAVQGTGTDADGNIVYDEDALSEARTNLLSALDLAQASRDKYEELEERLVYAKKVAGWWQDEPYKATAMNDLNACIQTSTESLTDYTMTDAQLQAAVNLLNTKVAAVDKKIYCSGSACGTDAQLKIPTNQWCYARSMQSKHWVLFWEPGYGEVAPSAVESILNTADKVFEYYANDLKFITINQGKSKADNYKMIIRLRYTDEWEASGSGIDNMIGLLTLSRWAYTSRGGQTVAHEIGHCFQYQVHCDNNNWNGWMYNWGTSNYNVFWEMCAQWQAYKFYPEMQFNNEWLNNTLNGLHKHPLCVELRYENFFIQDYFCHKYGLDFIGRLWNESYSPEDPLQAYMRLTMNGLTSAQKLDRLNDEMWEFGARMTTFDMDPIRDYGAGVINRRSQTQLTKDSEGYWTPTASNCIENFGNNAIRLNVPTTEKMVYVEFVGEAGKSGYTAHNIARAGWKLGFVALKKDGTRVYGDIGSATYSNPEKTVAFKCPADCSYLWLVVSGAPTSYWTRDWIDWNGVEGIQEQWPYKVKLHQTNVYGSANNNTYPDGITDVKGDGTAVADNNVYTLTGQIVRQGSTSLEGLPKGIYIVGGKKVMK